MLSKAINQHRKHVRFHTLSPARLSCTCPFVHTCPGLGRVEQGRIVVPGGALGWNMWSLPSAAERQQLRAACHECGGPTGLFCVQDGKDALQNTVQTSALFLINQHCKLQTCITSQSLTASEYGIFINSFHLMAVLMDFMHPAAYWQKPSCKSSFQSMSSLHWLMQNEAQLGRILGRRNRVSWKCSLDQVSGSGVAKDQVSHVQRNAVCFVHSSSSKFGASFDACFVNRMDSSILMAWLPPCVFHKWFFTSPAAVASTPPFESSGRATGFDCLTNPDWSVNHPIISDGFVSYLFTWIIYCSLQNEN